MLPPRPASILVATRPPADSLTRLWKLLAPPFSISPIPALASPILCLPTSPTACAASPAPDLPKSCPEEMPAFKAWPTPVAAAAPPEAAPIPALPAAMPAAPSPATAAAAPTTAPVKSPAVMLGLPDIIALANAGIFVARNAYVSAVPVVTNILSKNLSPPTIFISLNSVWPMPISKNSNISFSPVAIEYCMYFDAISVVHLEPPKPRRIMPAPTAIDVSIFATRS